MSVSSLEAIKPNKWEDAKWPLGAHFNKKKKTTTFAVYSKHATRIVLEIFNESTGESSVAEFELKKNKCDDIWRGKLSGITVGTYYGFRCWGKNWPFDSAWQANNSSAGFIADFDEQGNRFNPNKLLIDPYGREVSHERNNALLFTSGHNGGIYGTGSDDYFGRPRREWDTAQWAPKSVVVDDDTPTGERPLLSAENASIYEAHIRNLSAHPSVGKLGDILQGQYGYSGVNNIAEEFRGTYKAAGMMAPYIKILGFTAIEFMPVHEVNNSSFSAQAKEINHWGYMTQGFFAPDRDYAYDQSPGGPTKEFKEMVAAFHEQGIEVYLDVVYNHSGEGGNWGKQDTVGFNSLGGFDTTEYYVLTNDHYLVDGATGCGNQLNFSTLAAQNLVLDSLTYWIDKMGVDGFRFDLATVLGRKPNAHERENWDYQKRFFPQHPLLLNIEALGRSRNVEMIAEAWDTWGTYQVGNFPAGWGEWNGRYRDALRKFLKGDGNTYDFMSMLNGDYEHFNDQGGPQKTINFITAHDGFNLLDLVSYNNKVNSHKHPFGPSDGGADDNNAWDSNGDHALRRQRLRNFWTLLFFSRGVPLAVSGDEFARTQNGNNNPWNINSEAMWNNYAMTGTSSPTAVPVTENSSHRYHDNFGTASGADNINPYFKFAVFVSNLRKGNSSLRQRKWGNFQLGDEDVTYHFSNTRGGSYPCAGERCLRLLIDSSNHTRFVLFINMWVDNVVFSVPRVETNSQWRRIIDTASWAEHKQNCWPVDEGDVIEVEGSYSVHPWSIVVLQECEP